MLAQIEVVGAARVIRPEPGEDCDYHTCGSIAQLRDYLRPALQDRQAFGADFEASSLNTHMAQIAGWSVSTSARSGLYVPLGHVLEPGANLPLREVLAVAQEADRAQAESLWYNVAYDHELSEQRVGWVPRFWRDVLFGVFLVDSNVLQLGLKETSQRLLGRKMQDYTQLDEEWIVLSKAQQKLRPPRPPTVLPIARLTPYACADADHTRQIWFHPRVQAAIREQPQILRLEELFSPVLRTGNRYGVYLDPDRLRQLEAETCAQLAALEPQIMAHFPAPFKLSRKGFLAEQVKALIPSLVETTKGGAPTANVKVLQKYRHHHPVVPLLIQHAQLTAALDNYIRKLLKAHAHFAACPWAEGRVRFAFGQTGVPTGRMKCGGGGKGVAAYEKGVADVNAQSIPDHEKAPYLPNTRSAFCAPPGAVVVAIDFSQIELRLPANLSREPVWLRTYQQGGDIHVANAQVIANVREPGVVVTRDDKRRRGGAKSTSFALLYGGDAYTVARNADLPLAESQEIVTAFHQGLPVLSGWLERLKAHARTTGEATTFLGRKRRLAQYFPPEPPRHDRRRWVAWRKTVSRGEREAVNHPVQGGAADLFKTACVRADRAVRAAGWDAAIVSPQVLWIHDEVVWYVRWDWVTRVVPVLVAAMEVVVRDWPVPLKAEPEVGSRHLWLERLAERARREGRMAEAAQWAAQLAGLPGDPTGVCSTWGELVPYAEWVTRFGTARPHRDAATGT